LAVNLLPSSGFLELIAVAVTATGGIFLAVVLSGLLSALLTLGALELFFRAIIQRSALNRYLKSVRLRDNPAFRDFLIRKNGPIVAVDAYIGQLVDQSDLVPALAKIDGRTFYQLHYRQLCGQLASMIANEGLRLQHYTPLSDVLGFIAESRGLTLVQPTLPSAEDSDQKERYFLDLALRQVDVIQAELGSQINKSVYGWTFGVWILFYLIALVFSWVHFSAGTGGGLLSMGLAMMQNIVLVVIAIVAAVPLAFGTAVFSGVAFIWLDRMFAAK
jgi:hypothetical protein